MQRCAFPFSQEVPNDPDGYRYVWHSNHRGRIMLERVRLPEGQDAWLFSRGTLRNLDALVEGFRTKTPDPRYALLGVVIGEEVLASGKQQVPPPPGVPAGARLAPEGPAHVLRGDGRAASSTARRPGPPGLPRPGEMPAGDRAGIGLRLAAKLEAVLHRLGVDLMTVPDTWEADPLILGRDTDWQVTLARGNDGAWRFDRETVARVPDLFERLTPEEKTARQRRSNFHSAQQTMRTLLHAADAGDLDLAARCLDLDDIPPGPATSWADPGRKLKFVLDRIGRVAVEEIPAEADGPRYYYHRGPLGRIDLAPPRRGARAAATGSSRARPSRGSRRCSATRSTARSAGPGPVAGRTGSVAVTADPLALAPRPDARLAAEPRAGAGPLPVGRPGRRPGGRRGGLAGWLRVVERLACRLLRRGRIEVDRALAASKLRPLALQLGLWCLYLQLRLLDLPAAVVGVTIPASRSSGSA